MGGTEDRAWREATSMGAVFERAGIAANNSTDVLARGCEDIDASMSEIVEKAVVEIDRAIQDDLDIPIDLSGRQEMAINGRYIEIPLSGGVESALLLPGMDDGLDVLRDTVQDYRAEKETVLGYIDAMRGLLDSARADNAPSLIRGHSGFGLNAARDVLEEYGIDTRMAIRIVFDILDTGTVSEDRALQIGEAVRAMLLLEDDGDNDEWDDGEYSRENTKSPAVVLFDTAPVVMETVLDVLTKKADALQQKETLAEAQLEDGIADARSSLAKTANAMAVNIVAQYPFIRSLPDGAAVIGGLARSIAREVLTGTHEPVRDIDLVNIIDFGKLDYDRLVDLSIKYMPDDFAYGHGMSRDGLLEYLSSRDFTINEVLVTNDRIIMSVDACQDLISNTIRPTSYEMDSDGDVSSRIYAKALMLEAAYGCSIGSPKQACQCPFSIGDFNIALFLNKAMSRGADVAVNFTHILVREGCVSESFDGYPMALARSLVDDLWSFEFRPVSIDEDDNAAKNGEDDGYTIPPAMEAYYASNPEIRAAMDEYEDHVARPDDLVDPLSEIMERQTGAYSMADYDWINEGDSDRYRYASLPLTSIDDDDGDDYDSDDYDDNDDYADEDEDW